MIDHIGFPVSDYARAKAFYAKALAPLGYVLIMEVQENQFGAKAAGFGINGKPDLWIGGEGALGKALHVAILAQDRAEVDAFHAAAKTTARRAFAPTIIRIITARLCWTRTATISRPSATSRRDNRRAERRRSSNGYGVT
jgi:hypothetical protein